MADYPAPNVSGPTSSAPDTGSSWTSENTSALIGGLASLGQSAFQFGQNYVYAQNGNPGYNAGFSYNPNTGFQFSGGGTSGSATQQPAQSNTMLYIVIIVVVVLLLAGGIYLATRKG